jgi:hypothetical protein
VQVGPRVGTDRVTTSGLKAGEKVIVEGIQKVKSGVPVVAKLWTPSAERSAPEVENETRRVKCGAARSGTSAEPGRLSGHRPRLRRIALSSENTQLDAVVTFGSQVRAVLCVDQLRRDLDAVAALANVASITYRTLSCFVRESRVRGRVRGPTLQGVRSRQAGWRRFPECAGR